MHTHTTIAARTRPRLRPRVHCRLIDTISTFGNFLLHLPPFACRTSTLTTVSSKSKALKQQHTQHPHQTPSRLLRSLYNPASLRRLQVCQEGMSYKPTLYRLGTGELTSFPSIKGEHRKASLAPWCLIPLAVCAETRPIRLSGCREQAARCAYAAWHATQTRFTRRRSTASCPSVAPAHHTRGMLVSL